MSDIKNVEILNKILADMKDNKDTLRDDCYRNDMQFLTHKHLSKILDAQKHRITNYDDKDLLVDFFGVGGYKLIKQASDQFTNNVN